MPASARRIPAAPLSRSGDVSHSSKNPTYHGVSGLVRFVPQLQSAMGGDAFKVAVGREHRQAVANAELRQKRIDRSDLHACAMTDIPQLRRTDVIVAIRHKQRHRGKSI
jgi:hypothetical protein